MPRMIYDYTKSILERVSFAPDLFAKELKKAVRNLLPHEMEHLRNWLLHYTQQKPELKPCLIAIQKN
jgi:predicted SprT family Zn-dependent metalloprotease